MSLRSEKLLVTLVLAAILGGGFFAVATWVDGRSAPPPDWLLTRLDETIPLVPRLVWIYLSWYPATAVVLLSDRGTFRRAYLAYALAFMACVVGYVLLPVTIVRPPFSATGFSAAALAWLYAVDPPTNLFPSFHAAIATILALLARGSRLPSVATAWTIAVCVACLCTRQHYVLDVFAGVLLGGLSLTIVDRVALPRAGERERTRARHGPRTASGSYINIAA